ncbi:PadR family transcriptional regulator [Streptomyces sp. NPDC088736]|uniref:PadR family transcriptional regulator n=1 Tax=Streptomyces sp. NPDC088736 TaxID=3365881 RepID=UPI003804BCA8
MTARLPRKVRRVLAALDNAPQPLTGSDLCHITCHWPGTIYPILERLTDAGWIERHTTDSHLLGYQLTDTGRHHTRRMRTGGKP